MNLPVLQEMLELHEAGVVDSFKKGYNDAKGRHQRVQANLKRDLDQAKADKKDQDTADKADAEENKKVNMQAVADDINEFLKHYFTTFPNYDSRYGPNTIAQRYPTKEFRLVAAKGLSALADRIEQLRQGFNRSVTGAGLVSSTKMKTFDQQAKQAMGARGGAVPAPLIRFVRNENAFFKRSIKVNGNLKLNDADFKELLQMKMNQTNSTRKGDAAQALNILFGHMVRHFREYVRMLEEHVDAEDERERNERTSARQ